MFKNQFFVVCHNIRSRYNVGSIFRTADAANISKIYLTGYTPCPPDEKISKVALGAQNYVLWEKYWRIADLIKILKKDRIKIIALEKTPKAILYAKFKPKFPLALILGNEIKGLSKNILSKADKIIYLPMRGKKESLNVSVAFGICAYYFNRFRK